MTHYDTLGISLDATFDEIKDAYRQKLLIVHPDKQSTANTDYLESSDSFLQLRSAWNILSDVSLRQEYDLILRVQRSKVERLGLEEVTTADSTTKYPVNFTCTCSTIITVSFTRIDRFLAC